MILEFIQKEQAERETGAPTNSLFTFEIEIVWNSKDFRMLIMEPYKGLSDHIVHLQCYTQHILMSGTTEEVLC